MASMILTLYCHLTKGCDLAEHNKTETWLMRTRAIFYTGVTISVVSSFSKVCIIYQTCLTVELIAHIPKLTKYAGFTDRRWNGFPWAYTVVDRVFSRWLPHSVLSMFWRRIVQNQRFPWDRERQWKGGGTDRSYSWNQRPWTVRKDKFKRCKAAATWGLVKRQ